MSIISLFKSSLRRKYYQSEAFLCCHWL